jgi:FkbM family methyltransferase
MSIIASLGKSLFGNSSSAGVRRFVRNHYRRFCRDEDVAVSTRYGFRILASPRDYASYGIYFFGDYDPRMTDAIRHLVRPGMTAWDVGTERGWFTCLLACCVGKTGRVDAFEAFPGNQARLRANLALNDFPQVRLHAAAVSDRAGTLRFEPPSDAITGQAYLSDCSGVGYLTETASPTAIEVPAVTLDEVADREKLTRLDFIKMDIEGAETAALRGARETLRRFRPILAVEYNRGTLRRAGSSLDELDALLAESGYDRLHLTTTFRPVNLKQAESLPDEQVVFNAYCFPRGSAVSLSLAA